MTTGPAVGAAAAAPAALARRAAGGRAGSAPPAALEDWRERSDRLRHAVLEHLEIGRGQVAHRLSPLVAHDDVDEHRGDAFLIVPARALRRRLLRMLCQSSVDAAMTAASHEAGTRAVE